MPVRSKLHLRGRSEFNFGQEFLDAKAVMRGRVLEQRIEQSHFQGAVIRDTEVVFAAALRGQLDV